MRPAVYEAGPTPFDPAYDDHRRWPDDDPLILGESEPLRLPDPTLAHLDGPGPDRPEFGGTDLPGAAAPPDAVILPPPGAVPAGPFDEWFGPRGRLCTKFSRVEGSVIADYRNYYSRPTMFELALGLGGGAILANTSLDQHFRNWYQDNVRSKDTNRVGTFFKTFGEGADVIPVVAVAAVAGNLLDEYPLAGALGDYGERVTRAYLVGAPPMLLLQYTLGPSRPSDDPHGSQWRPFHSSHGVSGHAFIGSVPFLTAAEMVDSPLLKGVFYFGSTLTAWSRVNSDSHYLSQAVLGWWMGYLAVRAVNQTESENRSFTLEPMITPDMTGVQATWTR